MSDASISGYFSLDHVPGKSYEMMTIEGKKLALLIGS